MQPTRREASSRFGVGRRNASSPTPRSGISAIPSSRWRLTARCLGLPAPAIKLLLLTGARRGEILALQWDEVDLDRGCLRLKDSKTGAKVVRLAAAAQSLLAALPRSSRWVLPATKWSGHYVGLPKHGRALGSTPTKLLRFVRSGKRVHWRECQVLITSVSTICGTHLRASRFNPADRVPRRQGARTQAKSYHRKIRPCER